ncbi:MAG: thioredoxin fold domain-containing protein [Candidatus Omnitrophota bacterium]
MKREISMTKRHPHPVKGLLFLVILSCIYPAFLNAEMEKVKMKEVREIIKQPVNKILDNTPVKLIEIDSYWEAVKEKQDKPLMAFFYSDSDPQSQKMASVLKYVAQDYADQIYFIRVQIAQEGKPDKDNAKNLSEKFSMDRTPGVLFYDNTHKDMVLEGETYMEVEFKEFQIPSLMFWELYYRTVCKKLDKLLFD